MKAFILSAVILSGLATHAQDTHFSQFYSTPLLVNPAMTGIFDGKMRVSNNYRSQWGGLGDAYKTIHVSLDMPVGKKRYKSNYFGVGLMVYQDNAGAAKFSHTIIEGSLAYTLSVDDGDNFLAVGFRGGLDSREVDFSRATWDSQWNGDVYDPTLPGESPQLQQRTYFDFTAGMMWYYIPDGYNTISAGGSMSHITKPDLSFYNQYTDPLNNRIAAHASAEISMDQFRSVWVMPKVLVQLQGNQKEILAGAFVKQKLQFKSRYTNFQRDIFFSYGAWYRFGDAFVLATRFDYHEWGFGFSYDLTTSDLASLHSSSGGPEITLSYVAGIKRGQRSKHLNKMPKFF
ncbi:MAG: PorP/SprF family type IX secretion system membrane protein [Bacteroidetes bacterium]|nr:PorP/SprF family type IX secretion system membrane protein [Bacteroidota bacterium]